MTTHTQTRPDRHPRAPTAGSGLGAVQILSNALPGFRDLRAPLIAGYLWLVFAWLVVEPDVHHRPTEALAASVYDLVNEIGPVSTAIAVSVVAYLAGTVSQTASEVVATLATPTGAHDFPQSFLESFDSREVQYVGLIGEMRDELERGPLPDGMRAELLKELEMRANDASIAAGRELDLPATLLVADQPALFAEVGRLRAEGELRIAVAPPALALITLLAVKDSLWWLTAIPAVAVILVLGVRRIRESRKLMAQAMRLGKVASPSFIWFREYVRNRKSDIGRVRETALEPPAERG